MRSTLFPELHGEVLGFVAQDQRLQTLGTERYLAHLFGAERHDLLVEGEQRAGRQGQLDALLAVKHEGHRALFHHDILQQRIALLQVIALAVGELDAVAVGGLLDFGYQRTLLHGAFERFEREVELLLLLLDLVDLFPEGRIVVVRAPCESRGDGRAQHPCENLFHLSFICLVFYGLPAVRTQKIRRERCTAERYRKRCACSPGCASIAVRLPADVRFSTLVFSPRHCPNFVRRCARLIENAHLSCIRQVFWLVPPRRLPDPRGISGRIVAAADACLRSAPELTATGIAADSHGIPFSSCGALADGTIPFAPQI